jgi:hypothetical protein
MLGPVERADIIRYFAFRKMPIESILFGLKAVEKFYTITRIDYIKVAEFVTDVYKMFQSTPGPEYEKFLDRIYEIIRDTSVSPIEFIEAFKDSRHLALSRKYTPDRYFELLSSSHNEGIAPNSIGEHLTKHK